MLPSGKQRGIPRQLLEAKLPEPCPPSPSHHSFLMSACHPRAFLEPATSLSTRHQERPECHQQNECSGARPCKASSAPCCSASAPGSLQERSCPSRQHVLPATRSPAPMCWYSQATVSTRRVTLGSPAGLVPRAVRFGQTAGVLAGGRFVFARPQGPQTLGSVSQGRETA